MKRALYRLALRVRIWTLRYRAHETEQYIAECERDGLVESLAIAEWRRQVCAYRAEQGRLSNLLHPQPPLRAEVAATVAKQERHCA